MYWVFGPFPHSPLMPSGECLAAKTAAKDQFGSGLGQLDHTFQ